MCSYIFLLLFFYSYSPLIFLINECLLSGQSFSLINCNIRSLSANFDKLSNMLSELYFPFSLIGLTEIKQKIDQPPISNTDLCGYQFLSQPSLSNAGGVAFYINNNLNFNIRPEFTTTADDFEALWIEVHNNCHSNLLCGIIYRHPNGDLEIAPCKGIRNSLGFWIPCCGFRIPAQWIPDSKKRWIPFFFRF